MRYYEKTQLTISDDTTSQPKRVRLSESFEDTDVEFLKEVVVRQETFPVGSHSISLGNIAEGRFFYVLPKSNVQFQLNGSNAFTLRANKSSRGWLIFNQVDLIVSSEPAEVLIVLAGE